MVALDERGGISSDGDALDDIGIECPLSKEAEGVLRALRRFPELLG